MSVGFLGVKIDPPQHVIKSFLGSRFYTEGFSPSTSPSNTALAVGPWEWGTLGMRDPGDGDPNPAG